MEATQSFPISIIQGATYSKVITYYNSDGSVVDLTGYTATMIFRETVEDTDAIITLSTGNGSILINGSAGTVTFTISSTITAALANGLQLVYNLFIYSGANIVTPLLAGNAGVIGSTIR